MTTPTDDEQEDNTMSEDTSLEEETKTPPVAKKVSRFGPVGFQNGSKFGKGPTGNNPISKQRPGRAAARGR